MNFGDGQNTRKEREQNEADFLHFICDESVFSFSQRSIDRTDKRIEQKSILQVKETKGRHAEKTETIDRQHCNLILNNRLRERPVRFAAE